jgi:hypothetical protein
MELHAIGHIVPAGAPVPCLVTIAVTGPIDPGQVHNEATLIEEEAVLLHDQVRVLTELIHLVDPPIPDRVRLQAEVLVTGALPARIAQGVRAAEAQGTEVPEGARQAEVLVTEAQAGDPGVQEVLLGVRAGRSDLQEVHSGAVAADPVAADQVADEADNNSIIRL